jgi:hypothetical protein
MEGIGCRTIFPSTTKIGQIRLEADRVVSATRARDHGACLGLLIRILGYPPAAVLASDALSTVNADVFFTIVMARPFKKSAFCTPESRLTQGCSYFRTNTEHRWSPPFKPSMPKTSKRARKRR